MTDICLEKVLEIIRKLNDPFTITDVSKQAGIAWGIARQILMQLVIEGFLDFERTPNCLLFRHRGDKLRSKVTDSLHWSYGHTKDTVHVKENTPEGDTRKGDSNAL